MKNIVIRYDVDFEQIIDADTGKILIQGCDLLIEDVLKAMGINVTLERIIDNYDGIFGDNSSS